MNKTYIAIDLKSFYASVECVQRNMDPLDTCLVVADAGRTEKTICLAVSPALKAYGTGGRPRLFEVMQKVRDANRNRGCAGKSTSGKELNENPRLAIDYIVAKPRMALYVEYSTRIYGVYLRYIAPEDIHVYSIDEVFIDATSYLSTYGMSAHELAITLIREVQKETGITATAGIGSNLYLCKVAMDIKAKKIKADKDGVRIAELDERSYRQELWDHRPLTDFWRMGRGIMNRLLPYGIETMGDIARCSLKHEDWLYGMFGINAELIIDHAWGYEPVTIDKIKTYRPKAHSMSSGQVLQEPYTFEHAKVVIKEMADAMALSLFEQRLLTKQMVMNIGYDRENLSRSDLRSGYEGRTALDYYGREVPVHAHGTINLEEPTSCASTMIAAAEELYARITNPRLLVRRLNLTACHLITEEQNAGRKMPVQLDLFIDNEEQQRKQRAKAEAKERERRRQEAIIKIKRKFGKNAILKGLNFEEGATQRERNRQIGGHHE